MAIAISLVDSLTVNACADIIPERAVELAAFAGQASAHASAARKIMEVIDAVFDSARQHQPVKLAGQAFERAR